MYMTKDTYICKRTKTQLQYVFQSTLKRHINQDSKSVCYILENLCTQKLDLCFVVDASGSICDSDEGFNYRENETCNNWKYNVDFIRSIADSFDIGLEATRIGLVIFSSQSYVAWNLTA